MPKVLFAAGSNKLQPQLVGLSRWLDVLGLRRDDGDLLQG